MNGVVKIEAEDDKFVKIETEEDAIITYAILQNEVIKHAKNNQSNKFNVAWVKYLSDVMTSIRHILVNGFNPDYIEKLSKSILETICDGQKTVIKAINAAKKQRDLVSTLTARGDKHNEFPKITVVDLESQTKLHSALIKKAKTIISQKNNNEDIGTVAHLDRLAEKIFFETKEEDMETSLKNINDIIDGTPDKFADIVAETIREWLLTK